jgi:hypothetical protein
MLQSIIFIYDYTAIWVNIPACFQGGLPFSITFFAAGCIAKRNGWLDAIKDLSTCQFWLARRLALAAIISHGFLTLLVFPSAQDADGGTSSEPAEYRMNCLSALGLLGYCGAAGVGTFMISISVLHFFAVHLNSQNPCAKFLNEAQYGVYVFQTVLVPAVMVTFIKLLGASGRPLQFLECGDQPLSPNHLIGRVVARQGALHTITLVNLTVGICSVQPLSEGIIIAGWLYTIALTNLISWPFAYYIRKLPGLNKVL